MYMGMSTFEIGVARKHACARVCVRVHQRVRVRQRARARVVPGMWFARAPCWPS